MIQGAEALAVGRVERVAQPDFFPAGIVHGIAHVGAAVARADVEHQRTVRIGLKLERNKIVHTVNGQPDRQHTVAMLVGQHVDGGIGSIFFNGKQQIAARLIDANQRVVGAQIVNRESVRTGCDGEDTQYG